MKKNFTYKKSGVDIDKANTFVDSITRLMKSTQDAAALKRTGAFGALYALQKKGYAHPVLVSSTDGVGTKLLIAQALNKHDTIGIDLVAMNVNDIACMGAEPLFFLDYIACGRVEPRVLKDVMRGIVQGCRLAGCSLIGGETAEMPGMYKPNEYDVAGFVVGVVERKDIIDGSAIQKGDALVGLASQGLHSNGFSLVRAVLSSTEQRRLARELLRPTKIYVNEIRSLIRKFHLKGIAHITGGAFYDKLPKILPRGKSFLVYKGTWDIPPIFSYIQRKGNIAAAEMFRTFNMGIGLALVVKRKEVRRICYALARMGTAAYHIGEVVTNTSMKVVL